MTMTPEIEKLKALAAVSEPNQRKCSCHPDDAPVPCQHEHALTHCKLKASQAIITQLQSELAALKAQAERDGKTLELALAYAKLLPFYLERDDETEMAIDVDRFLQGNGVEASGYPRPTSQIQGEVGKEFSAEGEGE